jgi:hypothetical protein
VRLAVVLSRMHVAEPAQREALRNRIESTVAEGVAPQQAPGAE